ncbi:hypothetical protein WICMUC_001371 [Wickerhamomyces mucosus]|uniref:U3 small nucleolar RNA-associated protein 11 n=1 Tax=Wickerhamomyces mucosus TaxID=1378264 RepID=A0A9P8PUU6_9ASCO|nr:hypothetical protein WICMUC_001371 [Wickerhamomyces mucosus]
MAKLVHNIQKKQHRERSQPGERARFGLLEKKKDYQLRSKDYHKKQAVLKTLKNKIATRNPDEYYHAMVNKKTDDRGILISERDAEVLSTGQVKLLKTQDLNYIKNLKNQENSKIDRLQNELLFKSQGKHTVFVNDVKEKKDFDVAKHFDTDIKLINKKENRLKLNQLIDNKTPIIDEEILESIEKKKVKKFKNLQSHLNRSNELNEIEERMNIQKNGMENGNKFKIVDAKGRSSFKFKKQRKR